MEYFVADSYKGYDRIGEPFYNESGNLVTKAKCKCDRCGGTGIYAIGVENGHIKPHPAYGGICLACGGEGHIYKTIRLYTEKEYESMQKNKVRAAEKREQEREEKIKAEFEEREAAWMVREGFNKDGYTYIVTGETFSIKDKLKEDGFRFNQVLMWHKDSIPEGYEDKVIKVHYSEVAEISAWGDGHYYSEAKDKIKKMTSPAEEVSTSEWIEGDKISNLPVTFVKKSYFEGRFGITNILTFKDKRDNVIIWFTSTFQDIEVGQQYSISAKIKERKEYKGEKQTIITRAKIKAID